MTDSFQNLILRGKAVRVDDQRRVCLNDIHKAGGFTKNQKPNDWTRLEVTNRFVIKVLEKTTGKSRNWAKSEVLTVLCSKVGNNGGVWVHQILALAYAKYLSADLHYEVNEVFLRAKSGDATLADEVLQKSGPEGNEWAGVRALGRAKRKRFTAVLQDHEVNTPKDFAIVTNAVYGGLFGKTAATIRRDKGIVKKSGPLRDAMSTDELVYIMASEQLASERIEDQDSRGMKECSAASHRSASFIRSAIEADRADRQRRLPSQPRP